MQTSQTIARLIGPVFCAIGIGMLANQAGLSRHGRAVHRPPTPSSTSPACWLLVAGLAILNAHNAWTNDWRSLITALGWVFTGIRRLLPHHRAAIRRLLVGGAARAAADFSTGAGIVLLGARRLHHLQGLRGLSRGNGR